MAKFLRSQGADVYYHERSVSDPAMPTYLKETGRKEFDVYYQNSLLDNTVSCNVQPIHLAAMEGQDPHPSLTPTRALFG